MRYCNSSVLNLTNSFLDLRIDNNKVLSLTTARSKRTLNSKRKPTYNKTLEKEDKAKLKKEYVLIAKQVKKKPVNNLS